MIEQQLSDDLLEVMIRERNDLALLVTRMARRLSVAQTVSQAGNDNLARQATDYLTRKGLLSPLRGPSGSADAIRAANGREST